MPCSHKRIWEEESIKYEYGNFDEEYKRKMKLMKDGWEPFSVDEGTHYYKRQKPCEECAKVEHCVHGWPESNTRRCEECDPA